MVNTSLAGEDDPPCDPQHCYSQSEALEDLALLHERLRENHFDLFARRSAREYASLYERLVEEVDGPIRHPEFHRLLHRYTAFGRIGHAKTEVALLDGLKHVQQGGTIIPLSVRYHGEDMILDAWSDASDAMPPGSKVTSLGGITLSEFEAHARDIISADTDRLLRAQLELGLPIYLYLVFGDVSGLTVGYRRPDGGIGEHRVPAVTYAGMLDLAQARPVDSPDVDFSTREFRDLDAGVFYLRPGPFSASKDERGDSGDDYRIDGFRSFIEDAFAALALSGAGDLLIDLRGNAGGDVSFSDLLVARIADRPFTFASRYAVRAGALTRAAWKEHEAGGGTLGERIAQGLATTGEGEVFEVTLPVVMPAESGRFEGRVWVLIDRHSYSNAAVLAAQIQDYGFGTLMGQASADLATTYGAVESFTLPHSGALVYYPKAYMVRPGGSELVTGVMPDVPLPPQVVGSGDDGVLGAALAHINSVR